MATLKKHLISTIHVVGFLVTLALLQGLVFAQRDSAPAGKVLESKIDRVVAHLDTRLNLSESQSFQVGEILSDVRRQLLEADRRILSVLNDQQRSRYSRAKIRLFERIGGERSDRDASSRNW